MGLTEQKYDPRAGGPGLRVVPFGNVSGRTPPHDLDAEATVLAGCILDARQFEKVRDILQPDHFYSESNATIYRGCIELAAAGSKIDVVAVATWLRDRELIQKCGGTAYLAQLTDATPAVYNIRQHAITVLDKWRLRAAGNLGARINNQHYGDIGAAQEWLDAAQRELAAIVAAGVPLEAPSLDTTVARAQAKVHDAIGKAGKLIGVSTGLVDVDEKTAGLHKEITVLHGPPGGGKTAFALTLMVNLARQGQGVGIIELDTMTAEEIATRMACAVGRVNYHAIRLGKHTDRDYTAIEAAGQELRTLPIHIDDHKYRTAGQILAAARAMQESKKGLRMLVLDHAQKFRGRDLVGKNETRERELYAVFELLAEAAPKMGISIIVLSHENAGGDLAECKAMARDAPNRWRLELHKGSSGPRGASLHIEKQRHGPPDEAKCWFHPSFVWFDDDDTLRLL